VLALTHPVLFTRRRAHVVVEVHGTHTRGMTLVDNRPIRAGEPANVDVQETVDADALFRILTEAIASFG
jgi:inosine-uridine nucleoside N-ribohydrolase